MERFKGVINMKYKLEYYMNDSDTLNVQHFYSIEAIKVYLRDMNIDSYKVWEQIDV
jgi:intein-encoded DNA endonuclease-like protein